MLAEQHRHRIQPRDVDLLIVPHLEYSLSIGMVDSSTSCVNAAPAAELSNLTSNQIIVKDGNGGEEEQASDLPHEPQEEPEMNINVLDGPFDASERERRVQRLHLCIAKYVLSHIL